MITYRIIHHKPGRIRLEVPSLKGLSMKALKRLSVITVAPGIKDIRINPLNYNLVIRYDQEKIDIMKYLKDMASSEEMQEIIREIVMASVKNKIKLEVNDEQYR